MRLTFIVLFGLLLLAGCVDPYAPDFRPALDILVIDGTVTNLAEPQIIRLNRSVTDPDKKALNVFPVTKAMVEVVVDSTQVVAAHETVAGSYQLPSDFKGQVGHRYQLRFTLADGKQYASTVQTMPGQPPGIDQITATFNPVSLSTPLTSEGFRAGHDIAIRFTDPANQHNYYRWDWTLYEPQTWCRSCYEGIYAVNVLAVLATPSYPYYFTSTNQLYEDCYFPTRGSPANLALLNRQTDYPCRTQCWEIIYSHTIDVFDDRFTNGSQIVKSGVAHIPYYQQGPCLVNIRQGSLTREAYEYFDQLAQQSQHPGGLADTPPTASVGNVRNRVSPQEAIVGYFTASAISVKSYFIDRNDAQGKPSGLFRALNGRDPFPEQIPNPILDGPVRPPTAVCGPLDQRTPFKPAGWRD